MPYVTFYAIASFFVTTSGPVVEHINGGRYGTLWNFIKGLMERNYGRNAREHANPTT